MRAPEFISNTFFKLIDRTLGKWHWPFADKKFNLNHYFTIEKEMMKLPSPYAVAVVSTYGHGSNMLIKLIQQFSKEKEKRSSKFTHALVVVNNKDKNFRVAEAIGAGLQEATLLSAIGNRDMVKILVPDYSKMPVEACNHALDYVYEVIEKNRLNRIPYDLKHNMEDPDRYDCSELVYASVNYGFKKAGLPAPLRPITRLGSKTWAPCDVEFSDLFKILYDTKDGLRETPEIDGRLSEE